MVHFFMLITCAGLLCVGKYEIRLCKSLLNFVMTVLSQIGAQILIKPLK